MQKITFLLLMMFPALLAAQSYTTPNDGSNLTLDDLVQLNPSTVSFDGTNYLLSEDLIVSETDTLSINTGLTLFIDADILIDVHGTFISNAGDDEITIQAANEAAPYEGFWFYDTSEVEIYNTNILYGGGLKVITPNFSLTNSYLAHNISGTSTGAVVSLSNGSPLIQDNTFYMNDLPAVSSGANQDVSALIIGNLIEANVQLNLNRPQINMGTTGADTLRIIQNTIIGDPNMTQAGGIAVANLVGGEVRTIIDENVITNNRYGVTVMGPAFAFIRGNVIEDNDTQNDPTLGGSGISLSSSGGGQEIIATNNEIRRNLWGITVIGDASINLGDDEDNPGGNVFADNGNGGATYAIYNNTDNTLMAKHNCWIEGEEELTLAEAEGVIFHQNDDATLGEIIFDPVNCDSGMSIEEIAFEDFNIYPNPAQDKIIFNNISNFKKLQIFSIGGQLLEEKNLVQEQNEIQLSLSSGIYILKFSNNQNNISKKLIVE